MLTIFVNLTPEEKLIKAFNVKSFREDLYFTLVTANGMIKRSVVSDFVAQRYSRPLTAIRLIAGDTLADVVLTSGNSDVLVVTKSGAASFFNENEITVISLKQVVLKRFLKERVTK